MKKSAGAKFYKKPIIIIGKSDIKKLKKWTANSSKKRYRICLHNNKSHLTQEMLICTKGYSYIRPHKHPKNVSESYHVLEGALRIYILNNNAKILKIINLSSPYSRCLDRRVRCLLNFFILVTSNFVFPSEKCE